jgi:hypothetical protein
VNPLEIAEAAATICSRSFVLAFTHMATYEWFLSPAFFDPLAEIALKLPILVEGEIRRSGLFTENESGRGENRQPFVIGKLIKERSLRAHRFARKNATKIDLGVFITLYNFFGWTHQNHWPKKM